MVVVFLSGRILGPMAGRAGRPKEPNPRAARLELRLTEGDLREIEAAAKVSGSKTSTFAREAALARARAVIEAEERREKEP